MTGDCENCVVVGVGGQGIILVSRIIGEAALNSGLNVMVSEIHGMAQRGGMVMGTIRIGDVHSPMMRRGQADIVLGFEPVETYRHMELFSKKTTIVLNMHPIFPFTVTSGKDAYPDMDVLVSHMKRIVGQVIELDTEKLAQAGHLPSIVSNIIMLGALLGASKDFPVPLEIFRKTIGESVPQKFTEANLSAFDLGFEAVKKSL
jgi:indolepyruvate ferredoxin oxidoreductase beta subunit